MKRSRGLVSGSLVVALALAWFLSADPQGARSTAQDATPAAERTRLPSQYAFYPSQVAQPGGDLPGDPAVQLVKVVDGLSDPVNVAAPADGSGRLFVLE